ncbi:MAG: hypothetical protein ACRCUM_03120, partial [Mycoplasmoidaceae bacterium]
GNDVIESITFYSTTTIPTSGTINGIKLKVHIKAPYSWNSNILQLGNLGDAIGDLFLINLGDYFNQVGAIYVSYLTMADTYENRKILVESWELGNQIYPEAIDVFKKETTFRLNDVFISGDDVIDYVTYNTNGFYPEPGVMASTPNFKFHLKPEYAHPEFFTVLSVFIGYA